MNKYRVEIKCSNKSQCGFGKFGHPGRIWIRGYNSDGVKVYQEHIAFIDKRYLGPTSDAGRQLVIAHERAKALNINQN